MRSSVRQALGLAAVSGLLFFSALGSVDLWDEDEPTFAGAAREMLARQEWIVPYFNGLMLPDKPVLSYWVMMAGYKLFGETELAARAGSALFSVGTVLLTWLLGRRLFSPRAGVWAGLILASSLSFLVVARAATPDAVLTFFCTLALVGFVWSQRRFSPGDEGRRVGIAHHEFTVDNVHPTQSNTGFPTASHLLALAGSYAAMGMAVLAKGPIGVMLPAAAIGLYALFTIPAVEQGRHDEHPPGWLATLRRLLSTMADRLRPTCLLAALRLTRPLLGMVIVLAVAGPWYLAVGLRTEGAWLSGFFGKHNFERFLHPMEHHRGPFYYYPLIVMIGFFPWSLFLGPAVVYVRSRLRAAGDDRAAYWLLVSWIACYLGFFSLAATKLPNYIVPIYPALALLVGGWLNAWLSGVCVVRGFLLRTAWITLSAVGVAASIAMPLVVRHYVGGGTLLAMIGAPLIVGGLLCWWFHARRQDARAAAVFAGSAVVFWLAVFDFGAVQVGRHQTSRQFAEAIQRHAATESPEVWTFGFWRPSLVYYLGRHVEPLYSAEQVRSFCRHWPAGGFLLVAGDYYPRVAGFLPPDVAVIERGPWFLKRKELLLLGRGKVDTGMGTIAWRTPAAK
ncbi:MAG TPA: glycosyltransferase family 39 protein [Pirellulales bacterium]